MLKGEFTRKELTPDGLHPNDLGHKLIADEIISFLEKVREDKNTPEMENTDLPAPITPNAYENAKRLTIREFSPELYGFHADSE